MRDLEALANRLYVAVVIPDTIWWDDLTPEMQDGWRRGALAADEWPIDIERIAAAMADPMVGPMVIAMLAKEGYGFELWGEDGPAVGQVITIAGTDTQARWTGTAWEPVGA